MTTEAPTARQVGILRHALGWPKMYRNHFVTGEGSDDFADCEALVALGALRKTKSEFVDDIFRGFCYVVTEAGKDTAANLRIDEACAGNQAAKSELAHLRRLLSDVMRAHADPESPDYNECETSPCQWCARCAELGVTL